MFVDFCISVFLGALSGLGVGGGSILMLWLTSVRGFDFSDARSVNLLFFLASAAVASVHNMKESVIPFAKIFPAALAGCVSTFLFSLLFRQSVPPLFHKLFGVLLLAAAGREFCLGIKKQPD